MFYEIYSVNSSGLSNQDMSNLLLFTFSKVFIAVRVTILHSVKGLILFLFFFSFFPFSLFLRWASYFCFQIW